MEKATFAAGCFWGVEATLRQIPGVLDARCGYIGGHKDNPTYREVCSKATGHAEAVEVSFDPDRVTYDRLLEAFWALHDPTQVNRQGPDVGTQYRSAIFTHDQAQVSASQASKARAQTAFSRPIATEITSASTFWEAEDYHQRYFEKNGIAACHI